jgi:hypothetical protein
MRPQIGPRAHVAAVSKQVDEQRHLGLGDGNLVPLLEDAMCVWMDLDRPEP